MYDKTNELKWYQITFKQMSPIHIGEKNYGVLSETRLFIPGWTLWGALVNSYGKFKGSKAEVFEEGKKIFENITCFYPKINNELMFPKFKDGELYMGNISEKQFRINYTDVLVSTAIDSSYISAKDASLHEIEVMLHKSKDTKENLYWIGLLGVKEVDTIKFIDFIDSLDEIFVGGEISYGFGKMKVEGKPYQVLEEYLKDWNLTNDGSLLVDDESPKPIKNYIIWSDNLEAIDSKLEFIVQYDFAKSTPLVVSSDYYFVPGSEIYLNQNKTRLFKLKKGNFVKDN